MEKFHNILTKSTAQKISRFLKVICYIYICFLILTLILIVLGRFQYNLYSVGENYPNAIYAEEDHDYTSRMLTIGNVDDLRVVTNNENGKIELLTYIFISMMYAIPLIAVIISNLFLAKVFSNVEQGNIFVEKNAVYLLYYSILSIIITVFTPFFKFIIAELANILTNDTITLSTGIDTLNDLFVGIAFLVAAYIIHYGVKLQDEVDHTL